MSTNTKKALIYNKYLSTAGGGERAAFDLASALLVCGYEVLIASDDPLGEISIDQISQKFGSYLGLKFRKFSSLEEILNFSRITKVDLFVNHTYCSFIPNPLLGTGAKAIYLMMFPAITSVEQVEALNTYDLILSISEFTATYLEVYAEKFCKLTAKHEVLVLPISTSHTDNSSCELKNKEKLIINIGRFNVNGHSKCQLDAIKLFKDLKRDGVLDPEWSMICAGQINRLPENIDYFNQCKLEAQGERVEVLADLSFQEIVKLYQRASILIQVTGFNLPFGVNPEKCEHLGLVALDCAAYGVIAVCSQRSGISAIINHGTDGFIFDGVSEAQAYIGLLAAEFQTSFHQELIENITQLKSQYTFDNYCNNVRTLIY